MVLKISYANFVTHTLAHFLGYVTGYVQLGTTK